jgi:hypothetical protein
MLRLRLARVAVAAGLGLASGCQHMTKPPLLGRFWSSPAPVSEGCGMGSGPVLEGPVLGGTAPLMTVPAVPAPLGAPPDPGEWSPHPRPPTPARAATPGAADALRAVTRAARVEAMESHGLAPWIVRLVATDGRPLPGIPRACPVDRSAGC